MYRAYKRKCVEKNKKIKFLNEERELYIKGSTNISDLLALAYTNYAVFYATFSDSYPALIHILEEDFPQLTLQEKKFCALIYLNLSTKEIAKIDNVTVKAIELRKYRLRKKCEIDSTIDLKNWLIDLSNRT